MKKRELEQPAAVPVMNDEPAAPAEAADPWKRESELQDQADQARTAITELEGRQATLSVAAYVHDQPAARAELEQLIEAKAKLEGKIACLNIALQHCQAEQRRIEAEREAAASRARADVARVKIGELLDKGRAIDHALFLLADALKGHKDALHAIHVALPASAVPERLSHFGVLGRALKFFGMREYFADADDWYTCQLRRG